jgi:pimeloyl-ACP methyl ester carboxylesterase
MNQNTLSTNKSTNVRSKNTAVHVSKNWSLRAIKTGFKVLGPAAPSIAARVAERYFFTARRHPRPAWEHEILEKAQSFRVVYQDGVLPVWSWGTGRHAGTILLVHGWEGRGAQLGAFVLPLVERGFRVVTFDGSGHGDATTSRASMPDLAASIEQVVAAVGPLHGIIAHSMGAPASLLALTRGVDVSRVAFLAPPIDMRHFIRAFGDTIGLDDSVLGHFERHIETRFDVSFDKLYAPTLARTMTAPLLVVHDEDDREVPVLSGKTMADAWKGSEFMTTRGLGHRRLLKDENVVARVISFMVHGPGKDRTSLLPNAEPAWMAALT